MTPKLPSEVNVSGAPAEQTRTKNQKKRDSLKRKKEREKAAEPEQQPDFSKDDDKPVPVKKSKQAPEEKGAHVSPVGLLNQAKQKLKLDVNFEVEGGIISCGDNYLFTCTVTVGDFIKVNGTGNNKKEAKNNASDEALELLENDFVFQIRQFRH